MTKLVTADWIAARIGEPGVMVIDPRRPMKYLAGHLPDAINVPVYQCFGPDGGLRPQSELAEFLGARGMSHQATPIIYDSPEGQNAAMLAWILEYLGVRDILLMEDFFEKWKSDGREVRYRPVTKERARFETRLQPSIRATVEEVLANEQARLIDFRSREEFVGERVIADDAPGHIPGAINLEWRELGQGGDSILKRSEEIDRALRSKGVAHDKPVIAYCRSGPRAALGYLALRSAGYDVKLFDGSWAQWSRAGLPAEK